MTIPDIAAVEWGERNSPLLVLGPSLGTSAEALWSEAAEHLADSYHIIAWDLPGHGHSTAVPAEFTIAELAQAVMHIVDSSVGGATRFDYAGDSVGGCVGLQLLLDAPTRIASATLLCTGAKIGDAHMWHDRASLVRQSGTPIMMDQSAKVWFAPGFTDGYPQRTAPLLDALQAANAEGYARVCEALAGFDVRDRLGEVVAPVLAVGGAHDSATPPELIRDIADGVPGGRAVIIEDAAHLAPVEQPEHVADVIREHITNAQRISDRHEQGMAVRRAVLGDEHVDRANASTTGFTAEFQDLITRYAWGEIWTRPGLDRRTRSLVTITALIARGHHEELAMHVRAARRNGVAVDEIKEVILQSATYCGVPDANTAFRIAADALDE